MYAKSHTPHVVPHSQFVLPCTAQDKYHLYFMFDLMPGGDLMDVLVAEAKVRARQDLRGVIPSSGGGGRTPPPSAGLGGPRAEGSSSPTSNVKCLPLNPVLSP